MPGLLGGVNYRVIEVIRVSMGSGFIRGLIMFMRVHEGALGFIRVY